MRPAVKQQGVVIVMALLIVALIAALAIEMLSRTSRDIRRTQLIMRSTQANLFAEAGLGWAKEQLLQNVANHQDNKLQDVMPAKSTIDHVHGYTIQTVIEDAQAYLNLNNVSDPDWQLIFVNLIRVVAPKISVENAKKIVDALQTWINPEITDTAIDRFYLNAPIPYRPAHRLLSVKSELLNVYGMTPELYAALEPFIIALPAKTPINIQQCPPELLRALMPGISSSDLRKILSTRKIKPFANTDSFINLPYVKKYNLAADKLTAISSYFLVAAHVEIENQKLILYTLVERTVNQDQQPTVDSLWQRIGLY